VEVGLKDLATVMPLSAPYFIAFISGLVFWCLCQELIGPRHLFDALFFNVWVLLVGLHGPNLLFLIIFLLSCTLKEKEKGVVIRSQLLKSVVIVFVVQINLCL